MQEVAKRSTLVVLVLLALLDIPFRGTTIQQVYHFFPYSDQAITWPEYVSHLYPKIFVFGLSIVLLLSEYERKSDDLTFYKIVVVLCFGYVMSFVLCYDETFFGKFHYNIIMALIFFLYFGYKFIK